jgi:hypothetical protein
LDGHGFLLEKSVDGEKVDDARVIGYNFYRTEISKGEKTLKLISKIDNQLMKVVK